MLIVTVIALTWLLGCIFVTSLCAAAARGDGQLEPRRTQVSLSAERLVAVPPAIPERRVSVESRERALTSAL
jgi:hypothetical protein